MSRRNPENRKYKGGAGRALLVFLLAALILAALVLGIAAAWLGANLFQVAVGCCAIVLVLEFFLV